MKRLLLILLLSPFVLLAQDSIKSEVPFIDGKIQFETIVEVKGKTAKELYSDVKLLVSDIYKSGKSVIDVADEQGLYIVVKAITYYPLKDFLGTVNQKLEHTIKFQFKDERVKIIFTNLVIYNVPLECIIKECKGYRYPQKTRESHKEGILNVWNDFKQTISAKLRRNNKDW